MGRSARLFAAAAVVAVACAACATSTPTTATSTTAHTGATRATTTTTAPVTTTTVAPTTTVPVTTTSAPPGAHDVAMTTTVRSKLITLAAAANNLPPTDVTMEPTNAVYAYDPGTATFWAGAKFAVTAGAATSPAFQDAGAYVLFSQAEGGTWQLHTAGLAGSPCPDIPAGVVALWGWPSGSCHPTGV